MISLEHSKFLLYLASYNIVDQRSNQIQASTFKVVAIAPNWTITSSSNLVDLDLRPFHNPKIKGLKPTPSLKSYKVHSVLKPKICIVTILGVHILWMGARLGILCCKEENEWQKEPYAHKINKMNGLDWNVERGKNPQV